MIILLNKIINIYLEKYYKINKFYFWNYNFKIFLEYKKKFKILFNFLFNNI